MALSGRGFSEIDEDDAPERSALMGRIRAGDHAALEEALDQFWEPLVLYARGYLASQDEAEDAAQEAFVRLWRQRNQWSSADSLRGYLYRILRNHLLNQRRALEVRARWRKRLQRNRPHTPAEFAEHSELEAAVSAALSQLPPRQREVFTLARLQGLSYQDIALALDIAPQTVANQMSAALASLRKELGPFLPESSVPKLRLVQRRPP